MPELTGIERGTGAKMKADVQGNNVVFRGALKASIPFSELGADARGTLLCIQYQDRTFEFGAGAKAASLAAKIARG